MNWFYFATTHPLSMEQHKRKRNLLIRHSTNQNLHGTAILCCSSIIHAIDLHPNTGWVILIQQEWICCTGFSLTLIHGQSLYPQIENWSGPPAQIEFRWISTDGGIDRWLQREEDEQKRTQSRIIIISIAKLFKRTSKESSQVNTL